MRRVLLPGRAAAVLCALALLGAGPAGSARALAQADKSLAGQLLVATESLQDPRFARTVIYMVKHDGSGALGLIVNRPMGDAPLAPLLRQFGLHDRGSGGSIRLHRGGPVDPARGLMLHTGEYAMEGTEHVAGDVAVTTRPEVLRDIARGAGPRRFVFALGYSGWAAGQLEREIESGAWITVPADESLLFDDDYAQKWDRATSRQRLHI